MSSYFRTTSGPTRCRHAGRTRSSSATAPVTRSMPPTRLPVSGILPGYLPVYGICMGNQVCGLALGGETYKMKFGHRGTNQPVRHTEDGRIFITTQNHGFAVAADTLPEGCRISYANVNDGTLEGFSDPHLDITTVQFHPEAHGGPRDTESHFFDAMFRRLC